MAQNQGSPTQLRDHYLQSLGIVQYVSRGIADEVVVDNPVVPEADISVESSKTQNTVKSVEEKLSQQSGVKDLLDEGFEAKSSKKPVKQQASPDANTAPLSLEFVFWQPTDQLLIATTTDEQLPDSQQVNLLSRIVAAIDNSASLPQFDVISWPPHHSMQGGEQEAREFIATLIKTKLATKSIKLLLVLGESAENWLLSAEQKTACQQGLLAITPEVTAIIAPSLTQMLNQPQSKRDTWQIICHYFNKKSA